MINSITIFSDQEVLSTARPPAFLLFEQKGVEIQIIGYLTAAGGGQGVVGLKIVEKMEMVPCFIARMICTVSMLCWHLFISYHYSSLAIWLVVSFMCFHDFGSGIWQCFYVRHGRVNPPALNHGRETARKNCSPGKHVPALQEWISWTLFATDVCSSSYIALLLTRWSDYPILCLVHCNWLEDQKHPSGKSNQIRHTTFPSRRIPIHHANERNGWITFVEETQQSGANG